MKKVAQFYKVSKEQFIQAWDNYDYPNAESVYDNIILPKRASKGSACYDIFPPYGFSLNSGESITIPTGIRCKIEEGFVLRILPKYGYKYRIQLDQTAIINSDNYFADDEGHIRIKLTNDTRIKSMFDIEPGKAFAQGIFFEYGITFDDEIEG